MKKVFLVAATALAAAQARSAPPAALEPALKRSIQAASQDVFRDIANPEIRNRAYSVELLRKQLQSNLEQKRRTLEARQVAQRAEGLRERVFEETIDFLKDLSPEVDRMAKDSQSSDEFVGRLQGISGHIAAWSASSSRPEAQPALMTASGSKAGQWPPTEDNIEGPFYRPDAPFTTALIASGAKGEQLHIQGRVLDTDGHPIAGAVVDVWQADPEGNYDIADPKDRDNSNIPYRFRGRMRAKADGGYSFLTLMPGNYEIGEGKWRCKHIHYKVSAPGFRPLTTQLYFEGDAYNSVDPWWKASTTIPVVPAQGKNSASGAFDIVLPRTSP